MSNARIGAAGEAPAERWAHARVYATRTIADVTGTASATSWTIREIDAQQVPGARGPRCLVFESLTVVRRLWTFPASWGALSVVALFRLAEEAS